MAQRAGVGWSLLRKHPPKHMEPVGPDPAGRLAGLWAHQESKVTAAIERRALREGQAAHSRLSGGLLLQGSRDSARPIQRHRTAAPQ